MRPGPRCPKEPTGPRPPGGAEKSANLQGWEHRLQGTGASRVGFSKKKKKGGWWRGRDSKRSPGNVCSRHFLEGFSPLFPKRTSLGLLPSLGFTRFGALWGNALVPAILQGIILKGQKVNAGARCLGSYNWKVYVQKAKIFWGSDCSI